jgi:hypothetical protein
MGFNVVVRCESDELAQIVLKLVNQSTALTNLHLSSISLTHASLEGGIKEREPRQSNGMRKAIEPRPTLFVCASQVPTGLVAVRFDLPSMRALLPGVGVIVTQALEYLRLDRYTDCFDGRTMSSLKKILEMRGVPSLLDAVIQIAYLAGVLGDEGQSHRYLEAITNNATLSEMRDFSIAEPDLGSLLDRFMATHDPYDTLKAALAHHAFVRKKVSQAEASRNLRVSRSTLQSHLNMAERLNVARFFPQGQMSS